MRKILLWMFFTLPLFCFSQKRGSVWCFGDSAKINFSDTANIITGTSSVKCRGSCVSTCDSNGTLLFYANTRANLADNTTLVWSNNDSLMQNGDSIVGEGWYHELIIVPFPSSDSLYYVFSIGVTGSSQAGLYYSIVDISANGGLGSVVQKNVQLQSTTNVDCLSAVKHGNGRDWWIISRRLVTSPLIPNNRFLIYLLSPTGVSNVNIQSVGSLNSTNLGNICFNSNGNRFAFSNYKGLLELYDFDRCIGVVSNSQIIYPESTQFPLPQNWSVQFSPNNNILYLTQTAAFAPDICHLVQFDLGVPNVASSADTLWTTPFMQNMGALKLAPDGKIYLTTNYNGGYPYADTVYNIINTTLSVINLPDILGGACNFQPSNFSLGGKRSYFGLPNNPDYDMPAITGSTCDTITSVSSSAIKDLRPDLLVYYNPDWQKAFINAQKLKGNKYNLQVLDMLGHVVFKEQGNFQPPYFNKDLNCANLSKGMYIINLATDREELMKKFIKE